jgi:hypothetical protein
VAVKYTKPPSRSAVTRDADARAIVDDMRPDNVLEAPRFNAPGKHFRWVREKVLGQADELAVQTAIRMGFRPVQLSDLADDDEFRMASELVAGEARSTGVVRYGGLIGMVLDDGLNERRRARAQEGVEESTSSAHAVFGMQQQVGVSRGGLPVFHEDLGSRAERGAAIDPSLGAK